MNITPSILMVTWNRREYFERTIAHLLEDRSDFCLYIWDNGSADGVADIILSLDDPRIVQKTLNRTNVGQFDPWHWFIEHSRTDISGKLDDDILGEPQWMTRFSHLIGAHANIGTLGAWVYLPSEWNQEQAAHRIVPIGPNKIFQSCWVPGGIFLCRTFLLRCFSSRDRNRLGVPIDQPALTRAGFINGYPLPMSFAHHLDDPRSPYCRMTRPGGWDQFAAYTARMRKFPGPAAYAEWIAADAKNAISMTIKEQLALVDPTATDRLKRRIWQTVVGGRRLILK